MRFPANTDSVRAQAFSDVSERMIRIDVPITIIGTRSMHKDRSGERPRAGGNRDGASEWTVSGPDPNFTVR